MVDTEGDLVFTVGNEDGLRSNVVREIKAEPNFIEIGILGTSYLAYV